MKSRATLVYVIMLVACVGGLWLILRLGSSLILTRLLLPDAYGVFNTALAAVCFLELLSVDVDDLGSEHVTRLEPEDAQAAHRIDEHAHTTGLGDPCNLSHNVVHNFQNGSCDTVAARRTLLATCGIRGKAATDSERKRPPIPIEAGRDSDDSGHLLGLALVLLITSFGWASSF